MGCNYDTIGVHYVAPVAELLVREYALLCQKLANLTVRYAVFTSDNPNLLVQSYALSAI